MGVVLITPIALAQQTNTVTGSATYRERIALPAGAVFEASLEDVSKAGGPADVIGQTRLENPGQPPFRFSILYDPTRIIQNNSYAVRARVLVKGQLMFTSTRSYPVLTRGNGTDVAIMMQRAGASSVGRAGALGDLPGTFQGKLPCADCPGILYTLNLFPNRLFFSRMSYSGRGEGTTVDRLGRWNLSDDGSTLTLNSAEGISDRFLIKSGTLQKVDQQGSSSNRRSTVNLQRAPAFQPMEPRATMRGMFLYMADAANFTECGTRQRWPVAMEAEYKTLESAYLELKRQPREQLLAEVEARIAMRPNLEPGAPPRLTVVVERFRWHLPGRDMWHTRRN